MTSRSNASPPRTPVTVYLDIETAPAETLEPWSTLAADEIGDPPRNYTDPETIERWRVKQRARAEQTARERSALDALSGGMVVCVGVGVQPVDSLETRTTVLQVDRVDETCERELLRQVERGLTRYEHARIVTWNGGSFDLPFLAKRAMRHGVWSLAAQLYRPKPWGGRADGVEHVDLFAEWQQHDRRAPGRLHAVARYLGVELPADPLGGDGSRVADALAEGRIAEVAEHCRIDVVALVEIDMRLRRAGWQRLPLPADGAPAVRPPRPSAAQLEVEQRTALQLDAERRIVELDKETIRLACERVGVPWGGRAPLEDGPILDDRLGAQQLRALIDALGEVARERGIACSSS